MIMYHGTNMNEKDNMKLEMVKNLAVLLIDNNEANTMEQALSTVINSDTYQRLQDDVTRLYYQSPRYVYSFLENEIKTGAIR